MQLARFCAVGAAPCATRPLSSLGRRCAVYLRGIHGADISYAIQEVEFKLHETFPEPIRSEPSARAPPAAHRLARAEPAAAPQPCHRTRQPGVPWPRRGRAPSARPDWACRAPSFPPAVTT